MERSTLILTSSILEHLEGLDSQTKKYYVAKGLEYEQRIIESIIKYKASRQ